MPGSHRPVNSVLLGCDANCVPVLPAVNKEIIVVVVALGHFNFSPCVLVYRVFPELMFITNCVLLYLLLILSYSLRIKPLI